MDDINLNANLILEDFGKQLIEDLRASLKKNKVIFGAGQESKLAAKLKFRIIPSNGGVKFQLIMPDYAGILDKGRKPGPVSAKGQANIAEWGKRKGYIEPFRIKDLQRRLKKQSENKTEPRKKLTKIPFNRAVKGFGYVVARTISKKGYKARPFFTSVIKDGRLDNLVIDLSELLKEKN